MEKSIQIIKYLFNEAHDITVKDLQNLSDTLNVMKIKIRLNMLGNTYKNNEQTKLILENIKEKKAEVIARIKALPDALVYIPTTKEDLNKEILNDIYNSLSELERDLLDGNNYIMNEKRDAYNEIINNLINDNVKKNQTDNGTLLEFFGEPIAWKNPDTEEREFTLNRQTLIEIFNILSNERICKGIINTLPVREQELKLRKELALYEIILKNKDILKQEINDNKELNNFDNKINALNEERNKIKYSLNIKDKSNKIRIFRKNKDKPFPLEIYLDDEKIIIIEENANEFINKINSMIATINQKKLRFTLDAFKDKPKNIDQLMENINSNNINNEDIEKLLNIEDIELENIIKELNNKLNNLSNYTVKDDVVILVTKYYESCLNIINLYLDTDQERLGCTPLISFYCLKALSDCETNDTMDYDKYNTEEVMVENNHLVSEINREYCQRLAELSDIDNIIKTRLINCYPRIRKKVIR